MQALKCVLGFALFSIGIFLFAKPAASFTDPLARPNNFYGVHILFPDEIEKASKLVNSNGGEWGYVTIPIQIRDRNIDTWQHFLDLAAALHVIPILRLATEPDSKNSATWRLPTESDILDFANFLNSLTWPTKTRYVILFNEVNRSDEWGGVPPDPARYTDIVRYASDTFHGTNPDFYLILAGLDDAAPNRYPFFMDSVSYLTSMVAVRPDIFNAIDAFAAHPYPNPNFSASPTSAARVGTASYKYEYDFIAARASSKKNIFITETGWNGDVLSDETISSYFKEAFEEIWMKDRDKIVAVTPFLLESEHGLFDKFSLIKDGKAKKTYAAIESLPKNRGDPDINTSQTIQRVKASQVLGVKDFRTTTEVSQSAISPLLKLYFKSILGLGENVVK